MKEKTKRLETNAFRPHSFYWMKLDRIKANLRSGEFVVMTKPWFFWLGNFHQNSDVLFTILILRAKKILSELKWTFLWKYLRSFTKVYETLGGQEHLKCYKMTIRMCIAIAAVGGADRLMPRSWAAGWRSCCCSTHTTQHPTAGLAAWASQHSWILHTERKIHKRLIQYPFAIHMHLRFICIGHINNLQEQ